MRASVVMVVAGLAGACLAGCSTSSAGAGATAGSPPAVGADAAAATSAPSLTATPDASQDASPAPARTSWGPSVADWTQAAAIVADMTLEAQAGQVIVATYGGLQPPVDLVADLGLGGVIVMGDNVPAGADAAAAIADVTTRLAGATDRGYPVIVAVDQEGGPVARIGAPATEFPPGMAHGAADDVDLSRAAAQASATELAALGFTMAYAPVADVTTASDPTIGVRSPGDRADLVARTSMAQADGLAAGGVIGVLKHFPGHGSVPADSHLELPVQTAPLAQLRERDLVPFATGVEQGASAVMVAHIDVRDVDPGVPSSLSSAVVTGLLRDELGFEGVVITDSLGMAAVADRYASAESAVRALQAGADLLLMPPDARAARDGIVAAVAAGDLAADRLAEAAQRVVALQLHQASLAAPVDLSAVGSSAQHSRDLSAAALTLVSGPCTGPYVGDAVQVVGATEVDRARLRDAAERAGLATGYGDVVVLLGSPGSAGTGSVVVSLDTPYGLGRSSVGTASFALFGRTPQAFDALVDVLTGDAAASGTLPVEVAGAQPPSC